MNFDLLIQHYVVEVILACLIVGYVIKKSFTFIPNKYIPAILVVVGGTINCFMNGLSVATLVYGALMGLSSTGMHQAFTRFLEDNTKE